jgi:curved DNA-binding protein CbpA
MSFQIEQGLFKLNFIDHHAILGIPVDAEIKDIRKRYLQLARRLHPDSFATGTEADKQRATEFLSKLVNPAYEKLSQERDRAEYLLMLRLKGQQAARQPNLVPLQGDTAKELAQAKNLDQFYKSAVQGLATQLYQSLDQATEVIGQISELNLVYLMRKENTGEATSQPKQPIFTSSTATPAQSSTPTPARSATPMTSSPPESPAKMSVVDQYYRRAEELMAKSNFAKAILELRDGLKQEPNNSRCHSLMGMIYLKQNQAKMARICFDQALKYNPYDPMAQEGKKKLEKLEAKGGVKGAVPQKPAQSSSKPNNKSGGGFFGLFGGKKK